MKNRNIYLILAGLINLFTSFLHTIGGQLSLINPLQQSDLSLQVKTELLGGWHMITLSLFASSILLLFWGFSHAKKSKPDVIRAIGYLYLLFSVAFLIASGINNTHAPQWILLLPIGILSLIGGKKTAGLT